MTNLTDAVNALPASIYDGTLVVRARVLDLVKDTVAVPDTGTYVVADGVVYRAVNWGRGSVTGDVRDLWQWTVNTKKPKPTFFEVGKTYRLTGRPSKTFTVTHIDTHPATGAPYAHGWFHDEWPGGDSTFAGSDKSIDGWEEVS
ncbi:hypothetical protein ACFY7C_19395 [Streptomyces sp. NPDC012769]|uniref:hypothetical protein n=1 Tax=Streptomyces sp. NPDC012769 TaxID=3364848 RepID=UPI00369984AB